LKLTIMLLFLVFTFTGCAIYESSVICVNETDETVAVSETYSFAKKLLHMLENDYQEAGTDTGDPALNYTVRIEIYEPGESTQKIIRGEKRQKRSTGYIRKYVKVRIKGGLTEITWQSGWGDRTGQRETRGTSPEFVEVIENMKYVPASQLEKKKKKRQ